MANVDTNAQSPAFNIRGLVSPGLAAGLYAATLFVSAMLLFAVQPMFTKMVLPKLGGSPAVWSTAMVAFQAFLFAGYLYAHVVSRALTPARAAMVHLAVLAAVALTLPLGIAQGFDVPPSSGITYWLIALFAASIGAPFVALSASAPLLQNWFIATGHPMAKNPYVLYAASNLGSFAGLLAYPFLIEPFFSLQTQTAIWSFAFAVLAIGVCVSAVMAAGGSIAAPSASSDAKPSALQRLTWMALTAIPSGLCIAVTAYITTDLAAAPFLWVLPLALYLLTFVAVFRDRPWMPHAWVLRLVPYVLTPLVISIMGNNVYWLAIILLNLTAFTLMALACHGEAYRLRPEPVRLTEFYLWTSFGGVLGGIFAGLVAPNAFNNTYEYPILIVAGLLLLPGVFGEKIRPLLKQAAVPLILAAFTVTMRFALDVRLPVAAELPLQVALVVLAGFMLFQAGKPARFWGLVVLAFAVTGSWHASVTAIETARSFFGVHQVVETADRTHRLLFHGTTIHGAEHVRDASGKPVTGRPGSLSYYYVGGPISDAVDAARIGRGGFDRVAVVGLGTGSISCHKRDGERWTFFEIDPEVIRIARDPNFFRYLTSCGQRDGIVLGDARLTLLASPHRYDLIMIDAFSSDAIPTHLLTREAFAGYRARLSPNGVLAMHVSNRHMELANVVAAVGAEEGLVAYFRRDNQANDFLKDYRANAEVVVLAQSVAALGDLPQRYGWKKILPRSNVPAWTDDYSDVLSAILRKKLAR